MATPDKSKPLTTDQLARNILESTSDPFIAIDREWRCAYINSAAARIVGLSREEMMERSVWERFSHQGTQFALALRRAMNERVAVRFEEYDALLDTWLEKSVYPSADGITLHARDITERKHAEDALRESEERFRCYFELGLIGMAITSPSKGMLEVSDEFCRILGYERSELLQMTWAEMTHPDDVAADIDKFNRVLAGEIEGYVMDKRWIRKYGQIVDGTISVKCFRRSDGSVRYFVALLQDITERKRSEEALRRAHDELEQRVAERTTQLTVSNEELKKEITDRKHAEKSLHDAHQRLEMILNSIGDNFFSLDKDWRFGYLNVNAAEQMRRLGKDPALLIGKTLWEEFPDVPNEAAVRRAMSERVVITDELYYPPLREWVENHIYPSQDGGLVSFQKYITDRKRTEAALQRSQAYLAEGQRMTHTGSWAWNASSGELFWSEEQFRIFALDPAGSPPSLAGAFDLVHPDDRAFVRQVLEKVVRDKSEGAWDCRIVTSEGNIRRVHTTAHRVLDESGNLAEYVGTTMDITDRTLAEEALQQEIQERRRVEEDRRRLLQRLVLAQEEERRRIALEMHDDVGQRLALLQIKLEVLQRKPPAEAAQLVAQLVPLTEQVAALADAVRHLSHDLHSSVLEDLGLEEALRGLIAEFESSCALTIRLSAGRLPRVVPLPVATALYRIAQEALGNAAKHALGASVNIAVSPMGSKLRLSISDNGPGFDPQAVRSKGGLGLVSMQERAEMVGGTLAITSGKNGGTRVIATVPWMD